MGKKVAYNDRVLTQESHSYRNCRDVFLNKLESQALEIGDFTDNTDATGYIDIDVDLPANAIVVGWKSVVATGFTGDNTAVMQVGIVGDLNKYSGVITVSCLAAATIGAMGNTDTAMACVTKTVRVTVTGGADFGSITTGSMTVSLYYFLAN